MHRSHTSNTSHLQSCTVHQTEKTWIADEAYGRLIAAVWAHVVACLPVQHLVIFYLDLQIVPSGFPVVVPVAY